MQTPEKNTPLKTPVRPVKRSRKDERNAIAKYRMNMKGQHTFRSAFIELYHYSNIEQDFEGDSDDEDAVGEITRIYQEVVAQEQIFALTPFQKLVDIRYVTDLSSMSTEELMLLRDYYTKPSRIHRVFTEMELDMQSMTQMKMYKLDEELSKRKKIKKMIPKPKNVLSALCSPNTEDIDTEHTDNNNSSSEMKV